MTDILVPTDRSKRMSLIQNKDTKPELIVRRLVHGMGFRYSLHRKDLPGKPDLVFTSRHKVIFVHGCFWHLHGCKAFRMPKSNIEYWVPKLEGNRKRDDKIHRELIEMGWNILTIWECELKQTALLKDRIKHFLGESTKLPELIENST